jgi:hypothetical protein
MVSFAAVVGVGSAGAALLHPVRVRAAIAIVASVARFMVSPGNLCPGIFWGA